MPMQWRLQVLEAQIRSRVGTDVLLVEGDLYRLVDADRSAVLNALTHGQDLPFVMLAGEVVCAGTLDADVIADAVRSRLA